MKKKFKIGVFGLGCVGQGFQTLLSQSVYSNLEIKKIAVKNTNKPRTVPASLLTTNPEEILNDPDIDLVVELIDDADAAFNILKQSLQRRKPVVTANKKMLAENLEEIYALQQRHDTPVLYEGAVCGSIPILRNLEVHYAMDQIKSIEGIFNGSTNYILTKMIEEKKDYHHALDEAKNLGFAESDPTLDVKGFDPKYKLAITVAHAFGCFVKPDQILNVGIDRITHHDIRFAKQQGCTIKLIARAEKVGNKIIGLVAPQFVPIDHSLAPVRNEFNGINITGKSLGLQGLSGKGAGSLPTGLVVLADVVSLVADFSYSYPKIKADEIVFFEQDSLVNVRASFEGPSPIQISDFEAFLGGYQGYNHQALSGWVTTQKLQEWAEYDSLSLIVNKGANFKIAEGKKNKELCLA